MIQSYEQCYVAKIMTRSNYMFDTVVFNRILDGRLDLGNWREKARFHATHIQLDEIGKTSNLRRRQGLLEVFETNVGGGNIVSTESAAWDVSLWDQAKWGKNNLYSDIKSELDKLKKKENNVQDALIADTAIKKGFILVTDDTRLCKVTKKLGGKCLNTKQLASIFDA